MQVPHVSSYALTIEPKTALNAWIKKNKIAEPKETEQNKEFYYMSDFLKDNGFIHYEISNFAKKDFEIQRIGNIKNIWESDLLHILITVETSAVGMLRITPFILKI